MNLAISVHRKTPHFRVYGWDSSKWYWVNGSFRCWQAKTCWRDHACLCPPNLCRWVFQWWPSSWYSSVPVQITKFYFSLLDEVWFGLGITCFCFCWFLLACLLAGNFLVSKQAPHRPILLDFGLTKLLSSPMKQALAKMFLASAEVCLLRFKDIIVLIIWKMNCNSHHVSWMCMALIGWSLLGPTHYPINAEHEVRLFRIWNAAPSDMMMKHKVTVKYLVYLSSFRLMAITYDATLFLFVCCSMVSWFLISKLLFLFGLVSEEFLIMVVIHTATTNRKIWSGRECRGESHYAGFLVHLHKVYNLAYIQTCPYSYT